jgi:hypothetical protein
MKDQAALRIVKVSHTLIWAFFVVCILGAPIAAWRGDFTLAWIFVGLVATEAVVLLFNEWACPLTGIAARYTAQREDNFDIYLPLWLAKYNKSIFTPLYVLGTAYVVFAWWSRG